MKTLKNVAVYDLKVRGRQNWSSNVQARPVGINWDVAGHKRRGEGPRLVSEFDARTGLASVGRFEREVTASHFRHRASSGTTAVLAIDLDPAKSPEGETTNGDELLKRLAERLSGALRRGDSVGRLADGRFVVGLANLASGEDARIVAQKVVWSFSEPIHVTGAEIHMAVRIGIALPADRFDPLAMIRRATIAMRQVASRGGYEFDMPARAAGAIGSGRSPGL